MANSMCSRMGAESEVAELCNMGRWEAIASALAADTMKAATSELAIRGGRIQKGLAV